MFFHDHAANQPKKVKTKQKTNKKKQKKKKKKKKFSTVNSQER